MALPEQQPEIPPDQAVTEVREPELPPAVQDAGVQQTPPAPIQGPADDNGQPMATPVPAPQNPAGPSITIPAQNQASLTQMAKGPAANSQTWFGVFWLKKIKKALRDGMSIIFGTKQ